VTVDAISPAPAAPLATRVNVRRATLRATYIIWRRDIVRYWRDRTRLLATFAQPLLFLIIFGTGLSSALRGAGGSFGAHVDYQQFIYPGIIAMTVLFTSIFGAMSIVWDREFGFMKELLVAPIDRSAIAVGKALGGATQAMVQGVILLVLAPLLGIRLTPLAVIELIPLIFFLAFALSAVGVAVASVVRSIQGFQVVMNFLVQPMFILSGALFPLGNLPGWMTFLTRLDPVAYGVDALRQVVLGTLGVPPDVMQRLGLSVFGHLLPIWVEAMVLIGLGLVATAVAVVNFRRRD
jgi:ABC-2 type transport system permease protein